MTTKAGSRSVRQASIMARLKQSPMLSWLKRWTTPVPPATRKNQQRRPLYLERLEDRLAPALDIVPTFDASILNHSDSAAIINTINTVIATYEAVIADSVTVNFTFQAGTMPGKVGFADSSNYGANYADYRDALATYATSADDASAVASLPVGTTNPVNGETVMGIRSSLARALGFAAAVPLDSTITLDVDACNLDRTGTHDPEKYDLVAVVSHEINHALGIASGLDGLQNGDPGRSTIRAEDLFRFDQNGARSYNTDASAETYYSIDGGTTRLARFNQLAPGDFCSNYSPTPRPEGFVPQIQDAFLSFGATPNLGLELRRLDVMGWTLVGTAAPSLVAPADARAEESAALDFELGTFTQGNGPWEVLVSWGDGTMAETFYVGATGSLGTRSHTYALSGVYSPIVQITDFTSKTDSITFDVTVYSTTVSLDAENDLFIDGGVASSLSLKKEGTNYILTDPYNFFEVTVPGASVSADGHKVTVPMSAVTGDSINVTLAGSLTLDYANGSFAQPVAYVGSVLGSSIGFLNTNALTYTETSFISGFFVVNNEPALPVSIAGVNIGAVVTKAPRDQLAVAGMTAVFSAFAFSPAGDAITASWQVSTNDGKTWADVTTGATSASGPLGGTAARLNVTVGSAGALYRARFTTDGTIFTYSDAAELRIAAKTYWTGGGQFWNETVGDPRAWSNPYNWTNGVPSEGTIAIFAPTVPSYTRSHSTTGPSETFTTPRDSENHVNQDFAIAGIYLAPGAGSMYIDESLRVTGNSEFDGGSISLREALSTLIIDATAQFTLNNVNEVGFYSNGASTPTGSVLNYGVMTMTGNANNLMVAAAVQIINEPGGVFEMDTDSDITHSYAYGGGAFRNRGWLVKTGGTSSGISKVERILFSSSGTVEAHTGTLKLEPDGQVPVGDAVHYFSPRFNASGGATVDIGGGYTLTVSGAITGVGDGHVLFQVGTLAAVAIENVTTGATIQTPDDLFVWSGGYFDGQASPWTNASELILVGTAEKYIYGQFLNQNKITLASNSLRVVPNALLHNLNGAVIELATDAGIEGHPQAGPGSFLNNGVLRKTAGAAEARIDSRFANVGGTIQVDGGKLIVSPYGPVSGQPATYNGGTFVVAANSSLDLTDGTTQIVTGTMTASGAGQVMLASGSLEAAAAGATLNFPDQVFVWTGGTIDGRNGPWTNTEVVTLAGNGTKYIYGTVRNQDRMVQTTDAVVIVNGAVLENQSGATYELRSDAGTANAEGSFLNAGTLRKTAGTDAAGAKIDSRFANVGGTIQVDTGKLIVSPYGPVSGQPATYNGTTLVVAANTSVDLTDGTAQIVTGTMTASGAGQVKLTDGYLSAAAAGATLNFPDQLFVWTGGVLDGRTGALTNTGMVTLAGTGTKYIYGNVRNQDTMVQTTDAVYIVYDAVLENQAGATYELRSDAGTAYAEGSFLNAGTLRKTDGAGAAGALIQSRFTNAGGTIRVDEGKLTVAPYGFAKNQTLTYNSATFVVAENAVVDLTGGSDTYAGGTLAGTGDGQVTLASGYLRAAAAGASLDFDGAPFRWTGGYLYVGGDWTNLGGLTVAGAGSHYLYTTLANDGNLLIEPGAILDAYGNFTQGATGTLEVQLGGTPASGQFGKLFVESGYTVSLGGTLKVELVNGYVPVPPTSFTVLNYPSRGGTTFASFDLPASPSMQAQVGDMQVVVEAPVPVLSSIAFTTSPHTITAGQISGPMTIELRDQTGAAMPAPEGGMIVSLTSTSASGSFFDLGGDLLGSGTITIDAGSSAGSFKYSDTLAGEPTITVESGGFSDQQDETIVAAAASAVVFTTAPQTLTAGVLSSALALELRDTFDNVAKAGAGGLTFTLSSSQVTGEFFDAAGDELAESNLSIAQGASAASFKYSDTKAGTATIYVSGTLTTEQDETVIAAAPSVVNFTTDAQTLIAGVASETIEIELRDQYDNLATPDAGGLTFALSSTNATGQFLDMFGQPLPTPEVTVAEGSNYEYFQYRDTLANTATISVASGSLSDQQDVVILPAASDHLRMQTPSHAIAGGKFTAQVQMVDAFDNLTPAYNGPLALNLIGGPPPVGVLTGVTYASAVNGVFSFTDLSLNLARNGYRIVASGGLNQGTAMSTIDVTSTTRFSVVVASAGAKVAGQQFAITIKALNAAGVVDTNYRGTIHFTSTDTQAQLPADYAFQPGDQGVKVFNVALKTAGNSTISVFDITKSAAKGTSAAISVTAATLAGFRVWGFSTSAVTGVAKTFTVMAVDMFGNRVSSYRGMVDLTSSDAQAVLPADYRFTATDAGVHSFTATLKTLGSQSLQAADTTNGAIAGAQTNINVVSTATKLSVVSDVTNTTAGQIVTITVRALDALNRIDTQFTDTVTFTSTDPQAQLPANTAFLPGDQGLKTFQIMLKTAGSRTISVSDLTRTTINGTSGQIAVRADVASNLRVSGFPATQIGGAARSFTVMAVDLFGNRATSYRGRVHFTSTDPIATLPSDYTFTSADQGAHAFVATLKTPGSQTVTATDTIAGSIAGAQNNINVVSSATRFAVTSSAATTPAGQQLTLTVRALNASGVVDTLFQDTVHFSSSDPNAGLPADYTFAPGDQGVKTFTVVLRSAGARSITASDISAGRTIIRGTSTPINVTPASVASFAVSGFPTGVLAGAAKTFTVKASDAFGNKVSTYRGRVNFSSTDPIAVLPPSYTFTATDAGLHTFTATLKTTGSQDLQATDNANAGLTGAQTAIDVTTITAEIDGPTSAVRGAPIDFTLSANSATADPQAIFTFRIDWDNNGTIDQTVTGMSGMEIAHAFPAAGQVSGKVTAVDAMGRASAPAAFGPVGVVAVGQRNNSDTGNTDLYIGGTTGNDAITITPADATGLTVNVAINGVNQPGGPFAPTGNIFVFGLAGADNIQVAAKAINNQTVKVAVPTVLIAGTGNSTLSVAGSIASNVLVGNQGNDTVIGGAGRDILIGGLGADTLRAGSGGNILIGGATIHDANASALAILTEWARTDADYATRVRHLFEGGGDALNDTFLLDPASILSDPAINSLFGGAGLDWFWLTSTNLKADTLFNVESDEILTVK